MKSPLCVILEVQSSCHCPEVLHLLHSNFLIIFLSYRLGVCVCMCVCPSVSACETESMSVGGVAVLACPATSSCASTAPPQAGHGYPTLTCLIVCLSQGPPVSECACSHCVEEDTCTYAHSQARHKKWVHHDMEKTTVSQSDTVKHAISVCPIKMWLYQRASLKSAYCFKAAETSAQIPPADLQTAASHQQLENQPSHRVLSLHLLLLNLFLVIDMLHLDLPLHTN